MSRTPLFDAVASQIILVGEHGGPSRYLAWWQRWTSEMRLRILRGAISDRRAAESLELAARLVVDKEVPHNVAEQTVLSYAQTHKGKPTS